MPILVAKVGNGAAYKDGMIVDILPDSVEAQVSSWTKNVFALVKVSQAVADACTWGVCADGETRPSACAPVIPLAVLAAKLTGAPADVEAKWRAKDTPVQVYTASAALVAADVKRAKDVVFPDVPDLNAVASGTYTVGTSGNYTTLALAWADAATTLTGDLNFVVNSNLSVSSGAYLKITNLGGFTCSTYGDTAITGDPTVGRLLTLSTGGGDPLFIEDCHNGKTVLRDLRFVRSNNVDSTRGFIHARSNSATTAVWTCHVYNCFKNGNGNRARGVRLSGGSGLTFWCHNVVVYNCAANGTSGGEAFLVNASGGAGKIRFENCVAEGCYKGFAGGSGQTIRNCYAFGNTVGDIADTTTSYFVRYTYTADATANGTFAAGSGGNIGSVSISGQLVSTSRTNANYLKLADAISSPSLAMDGERVTVFQSPAVGIRGGDRPGAKGYWSIGVDQSEPTAAPIAPWKLSVPKFGVGLGFGF